MHCTESPTSGKENRGSAVNTVKGVLSRRSSKTFRHSLWRNLCSGASTVQTISFSFPSHSVAGIQSVGESSEGSDFTVSNHRAAKPSAQSCSNLCTLLSIPYQAQCSTSLERSIDLLQRFIFCKPTRSLSQRPYARTQRSKIYQ